MQYILYTYYRSSATAKVRGALHFKGLEFESRYIELTKGQNYTSEYAKINPSQTVPSLVLPDGQAITQSSAILEYIEEAHPSPPLLPSDHTQRAIVRSLVSIMACSIQPLSNSRTIKRVKAMEKNSDPSIWLRDAFKDGLVALEGIMIQYSGKYSVGDNITMADICLAPTIESAIRYGASLQSYPTIQGVFDRIKLHPAIEKADWRHQPDTPMDLQ